MIALGGPNLSAEVVIRVVLIDFLQITNGFSVLLIFVNTLRHKLSSGLSDIHGPAPIKFPMSQLIPSLGREIDNGDRKQPGARRR
ncbi:MAG: hypothetical protein P9M14_06360 [Candidatus Alcyoniella australis]|nr:hypothetical protein [Candidatus Alcyoniella australis]